MTSPDYAQLKEMDIGIKYFALMLIGDSLKS